jgi:UDP-GlcNAc3NAcA epimerase
METIAQEVPVVIPLHPRTRKALAGIKGLSTERLRFIDPVGYLDMTMLEKHARLIATDSGGVQKEAYFHGVPCVTLRTETEWVELVERGWNRLASPESAAAVLQGLHEGLERTAPRERPELYGGGRAAGKIAQVLSEQWHKPR